jgi:ribosome-binding protein aMBF1 (putative translation factor)
MAKKVRDAVAILEHRQDPKMGALIEREVINSQVAGLIYRARMKAGLTQRQLADLVGTKQPVIARLEHADYPGHSLSMLQRIAAALNQRIEVRFVPLRKRRAA